MDEELIRDLIREQASTAQAVRDMGESLDKFEKRLFGNGQPGALAYLDKKIDDLDAKVDVQARQVASIDKRQAVYSTKTHSLSAVIGALGAALLEWVATHFHVRF